jgi:uncharacterized protein YqcC (DUF446 family)
MWWLAFKSKACAKIGFFCQRIFCMDHQQARDLLLDIELQLRTLALWSHTPPPATAFASQAPFCCDSMPFAQWLQFVFLPRMRALIDGGLPLPTQISVCPMAEEAFAPYDAAALVLINRIADLDELLSGKRAQSVARR